MAYSRAPQAASDHRVPITARVTSPIGSAQIGRLSDSINALTSSVGTTVTSHTAEKMPTSEVDHGSESAISTAQISAVFAQATGSRQTGSAGLGDEVAAPMLTPCLRARD